MILLNTSDPKDRYLIQKPDNLVKSLISVYEKVIAITPTIAPYATVIAITLTIAPYATVIAITKTIASYATFLAGGPRIFQKPYYQKYPMWFICRKIKFSWCPRALEPKNSINKFSFYFALIY